MAYVLHGQVNLESEKVQAVITMARFARRRIVHVYGYNPNTLHPSLASVHHTVRIQGRSPITSEWEFGNTLTLDQAITVLGRIRVRR